MIKFLFRIDGFIWSWRVYEHSRLRLCGIITQSHAVSLNLVEALLTEVIPAQRQHTVIQNKKILFLNLKLYIIYKKVSHHPHTHTRSSFHHVLSTFNLWYPAAVCVQSANAVFILQGVQGSPFWLIRYLIHKKKKKKSHSLSTGASVLYNC